MEQNRHLGDAIVTGHKQTGDKVVASITSQVEHWQLNKKKQTIQRSVNDIIITSQHTVFPLQERKY